MGVGDDYSTRDTAVRADTKIDSHMQECVEWRKAVHKSFAELTSEIKTLTSDVKSLNTRVILIIGGIIALSKLADWILPLFHGGKAPG